MRLPQTIVDLIRNPETPWYAIVDVIKEEAPDMAKAYVVRGEIGEYSDRTDWTVAVFLDPEAANKFCELLKEWAEEHKKLDYDEREDHRNRLDNEANNVLTWGSRFTYVVESIELRI